MIVATKLALALEQMVTSVKSMSNVGFAGNEVKPSEPSVAPLGGNSVKCGEFVVPFAPATKFLIGAPEEIRMYPPDPDPPGPPASIG